MSIEAFGYVWENSDQKGSKLMVLLAIASLADEDGRSTASTPAIARRARLSPRAAQYAIRLLEDDGEMSVDYGAGPGGRNVYDLATGAYPAPVQTVRPARVAPALQTNGGANRAPVQTVRGANRAPVQTVQGANDAPPLQSKRGGANRAPVQTGAPPLIPSSSSSAITPQLDEYSEEDAEDAVGGPAGIDTPTLHRDAFGAICDACGLDTAMLDVGPRASVGKLANECVERDISAAFIRQAGEAWYTVKWKFRDPADVTPPKVSQLRTWLGECRKASQSPARKPAKPAESERRWIRT